MKKRALRIAGFALEIAAAFAFGTAYSTVQWSSFAGQFGFIRNYGQWNVPFATLESALNLAAIIVCARVAMKAIDSFGMRSWTVVPYAATIWGIFYYWSRPFVLGITAPTGYSIVEALQSRWLFFRVSDFFGYAAGSLIVIGAEILRRRMIGMRVPMQSDVDESVRIRHAVQHA